MVKETHNNADYHDWEENLSPTVILLVVNPLARDTKYYGHSWTLITVGVFILIVAIGIMSAVPKKIVEREINRLELKASNVGKSVVAMIESLEADSVEAQIKQFEIAVKGHENLIYAVLKDSKGGVLAAFNEAGAIRLGYAFPIEKKSTIEDGGIVRVWRPVALADSTRGTLYLGKTDPTFSPHMRQSNLLFLGIGFILILLSIGIFVSVHQISLVESRVSKLKKLQKDLSLQKGTLESQVTKQQQTEAELKESEQRYRFLLENAMESTFADLEALNKSLEVQKAELEVEVQQRTTAQIALAKYADRLQALNAVERLLVSEDSLDIIVSQALKEIKTLVACDMVSVLQLDLQKQDINVIGALGLSEDQGQLQFGYTYATLREKRNSWLYIKDLRELADRSDVERQLVDFGLVSFGRATLTFGESIVGALIVSSRQPDSFSPDDITAIQDIADLLSIAMSQQRHRIEQERYEQELIAERDRAEEMARLKTAFLANMSHEIRTPLSGIIGFSQVLHEEVSPDQREFTGLIYDAANRLLHTINSVLDLSKLEANKEEMQFTEVDVSTVVQEGLLILQSLARKKEIELVADTTKGLKSDLDRNALQSIVNNLVGNAIKFTEHGRVTVTVKEIDDEVRLSVQDTGVGISQEFIPFLFDEFRQEYMGIDRPHEGSGLGLAIVHKLIIRLKGRIEVDSTLGKGTTFNVYFPVSKGPVVARKKGSKELRFGVPTA